jgi:hypothetical protein
MLKLSCFWFSTASFLNLLALYDLVGPEGARVGFVPEIWPYFVALVTNAVCFYTNLLYFYFNDAPFLLYVYLYRSVVLLTVFF